MSKDNETPFDTLAGKWITRLPTAPLAEGNASPSPLAQPRGGPDDADLHRQTLDAATTLGEVPGATEAKQSLQRRQAMLDLSIAQDDAVPGLLVKRGVQGVAVGGIGYVLYRVLRALLKRWGG